VRIICHASRHDTYSQVALGYTELAEEAQCGLVHRRWRGDGAERLLERFPLPSIVFQGRQKGGAVGPHVEGDPRIIFLFTCAATDNAHDLQRQKDSTGDGY
jgi:hypothetical protein